MGLSGGFEDRSGRISPILEEVTFAVPRGRTTAIVGETGSGKSMTMLAVLGLTPRAFRRTSGTIRFAGRELPGDDETKMRTVRGYPDCDGLPELAQCSEPSVHNRHPAE